MDSDSTSPSKTRTSVSRERTTYASTSSPDRAAPTTRCASSRRSRASLTGGAADRQLGHAQCRLPGGDGHALPELAAGAGPGPEVVSDRIDAAERLGAVADQVGGAPRLGDLAVLDGGRLGHFEHEVARGRVHLTASELGAVDAVRRLAHDLLGVVLAGEKVRVGHAHHREVLVRLPSSVPALFPPLLAGADEIPHVVREHAVLDEH